MLKGCSKIILMLPLFSMALDAGEIKGSIKDGKTHEPVIGASVFLRSDVLPKEGLNALSEDGNYRFPNLKAGTYTVSADFAGAKAESTVTITDEQTQDVALVVNMMAAQAATYKIETTGTRLPTAPAHAVSPVSVIDRTEIDARGSTRIEDVINAMPQSSTATAPQSSAVSNGSNGTATVNLRGLGTQRTLVLIDGRRLGPGNPNGLVPAIGDLNFIPTALVDRVDILTGGSSAVYGADAVAGVVNFITKKDFEGVQLDVGWDFYQHGQQETSIQAILNARGAFNPNFVVPPNTWQPMGPKASLIIGVNSPDGKGNVTAYGQYRLDFGIIQKDYDYSSCALFGGDATHPHPGSLFSCGGSSTSFPGRFLSDFGDSTLVPPTGGGPTTIRSFNSNLDQFNYNPLNYYQRPDERWNLGAFAHYKIAPFADVYSQGMFMGDYTVLQVGPGGLFIGDPVVVNCANPLLQQNADLYAEWCGSSPVGNAGGVDGILVGRRNVEGGGRQGKFTHDAYRYVFGVRGDFLSNWSYDVYHQYMVADLSEQDLRYFNVDRLAKATNVITTPAGNQCVASTLAPNDPNYDPDCVPYDLFNLNADGTSKVTQAMLDYLQTPGVQVGRSSERVVNGNITGNLGAYGIKSPLACEGVSVNAGGEYRFQTLSFMPDLTMQTGKLSGFGGRVKPLDVYFSLAEGFAEARVPLVEDLPAMKMLQVEGAYRYSNYLYNGNQNRVTHTFKVGGIWEFMDNMRVRGSFQRAVRAPTLSELFATPVVNLDGATDPCALQGHDMTDPANIALRTACITAFGATAFPGNDPVNLAESPAGQYNGQFGGTATLNPEASNTIALGVFLQPSFIPGLQVSVDYFNISIDSFINNVGADLILNRCLNSIQAGGTGGNISPSGATWCSLVVRDPGPSSLTRGSLWLTPNGYVTDHYQPLGNQLTDGLDFFVGYDLDTKTFGGDNWGRVYIAGNGTWLNRLQTQPLPTSIDATTYDCSGLYGSVCGGPSPKWRHKLRATWDTWFGLSLSAQWRFLSGVMLDAFVNNIFFNADNQRLTDQYLGARHYLDVSAAYAFMDMFTFRFGVNNVLDQDPPLAGGDNVTIVGGGNGNTYPSVYDATGRYFFMNGTVKF